jgi:uncharacterized membrane protein
VGLSASELKRKALHVAMGGFAFLLRFLTWPQAAGAAAAAFVFNWQVLPRIGGRGLWRGDDRDKGYPLGILLYPLAVLALVLAFRDGLWKVAAVWSMLAFGDGMAALVGQSIGGPRLPWNDRKGWSGFAAFVVFGTVGAATLMAWSQRLPLEAASSPRIVVLALALALVCALVESVPTSLDDNLTVPLVGGLFLALVAEVHLGPLLAQEGFGRRVLLGLAINLVLAVGAFAARSIDLAGAASAVVIGTAITAGLGLGGLALMITFFVLGSAVTKLGYRVKASRGIAQEKGGARGWRNAWANGGVPALLALVAGAFGAEMGTLDPTGPGDRMHFVGSAFFALTAAYAASVATAAADTCSSEIGKAYGRRTFLVTSLEPVAPGTEGAISLEGTLGGLAGASIIAGAGWAMGLLAWPAAVVVAVAGVLGSLAESFIGTVAERRGWMGNDLLNAVNTAIGAGMGVALAHVVGAAWSSAGAGPVFGP